MDGRFDPLFTFARKERKGIRVKVIGNLVLPYVDCVDAYHGIENLSRWTRNGRTISIAGREIESGRMICGGLSSGGIYRGSINRRYSSLKRHNVDRTREFTAASWNSLSPRWFVATCHAYLRNIPDALSTRRQVSFSWTARARLASRKGSKFPRLLNRDVRVFLRFS